MNVPSQTPPVVACYCATFLKPEMMHIYRQITGLERVRPIVITQKRECAEVFPFESIFVAQKPWSHFLRRFWWRQLLDRPWQISGREVATLLQILRKTEAQLLHIYFGHISVHLLPLISAWSKPSVVSFHGADVLVDMKKTAYRRATQQMLAAVQCVLVRSESLRSALLDLGCAENKIEMFRTGIPLAEFPFRERSYRADGNWRFVQAGRLIEKKGWATTLRAFAIFLQKHPKSILTIAGEGPLLQELKTSARDLKIESSVVFVGFASQSRLREIFYESHIFLHPSEMGRDGNQEGIPNSMLEAMASGLPVFATNHGGIPEAVESGRSGVLVNEGDYEALARALLDAVQDRAALARLATAGAEVVAHRFEQKSQIRRLEDIYLQTMEVRHPA